MSRDDVSDFKLRAGRIRDRGARVARGERMYVPFVAKALQAAARANGGPLTPAQWRGDRRVSGRTARPRKGRCCQVGRGQVRAEGLKRWKADQRASGLRLRRAVVKARIVRLRSGSKAADAHVRYLQRDGVTRDGQRGRLYGSDTDDTDGHAFVERGREDRHQFRFIVAPGDGEEVRDLREFTRDLMTKMEDDLGTRLDWVAVDHFNTGHPHSHVLIRGKDHLEKDLVIAQDYITDGLRIRAEKRLTQELGLVTDLEYRQKLERAIQAERFTGLDRQIMAMAPDTQIVDLRPESWMTHADQDLTHVVGRLKVLERYNLAWEEQPGVWSFSHDLQTTLETLAERNDILNAMHRALSKRGRERAPGDYVIGGDLMPKPVVGQVIGKRLTDELGEKVALIVDGVDGKTYHVSLGPKAMAEEAPLGSIVQVGRPPPGSRAGTATSWPCGTATASISRACTRLRPSSKESAFPATTTTATSPPTSAGWRRCAALASWSAMVRTTGPSRRTSRSGPRPTT